MDPLISVDRARQAINRTTWPTGEISRVTTLVGVVSQAAELWCRRKFARATHDLVLPFWGNPLWLPNGPIHSVTTLIDVTTNQPIPFELIASLGQICLNRCGGCSESENTDSREKKHFPVRIVYEGGFDPIPDDIQEAIAIWVAAAYWQTKQDPSLAPGSPPPAAASFLLPYRRTILT